MHHRAAPRSTGNGFRRVAAAALAIVASSSLVAALEHGRVHAAGFPVSTTGANADGQLGDGTRRSRSTPTPAGVEDAVQVAAGRATSYALDDQGRLWAWGDNSSGQIGDGTTIDRLVPVMVLDQVAHVAAGDAHVIALRGESEVWTWGANGFGQLGLGDTHRRLSPTRVSGAGEASDVAAGRASSYVLDSGLVRAWGDNSAGQLGDGTTTRRLRPVIVAGLSTVDDIEAGGRHALAMRGDGVTYAWGANEHGQLGDGTTTSKRAPVRIATGFAGFAAGATHTIARTLDGGVLTWGRNDRGQLGLGDTMDRKRPTAVPGLGAVDLVAAGASSSYAVDEFGALFVWGANGSGQLGDGTTTQRRAPVRLAGSPAIRAVAGGAAMSIYATGPGDPNPGPDVSPPTAPGQPIASSTRAGQVDVTWEPATDDRTSYLTYLVYRDGLGEPVGEVGRTAAFTDVGLTPGSTHTYRVRAFDGTNLGAFSPRSDAVVISGDTPPSGEPLVEIDFSDGLARVAATNVSVDDAVGSPTDEPPSAHVSVTGQVGFGRIELEGPRGAVCAAIDVRVESVQAAGRYALIKIRNADGRSIARLSTDAFGRLTVRSDLDGTTFYPNVVLPAGEWHRVELCADASPTGIVVVRVDDADRGRWLFDGGEVPIESVQFGDNDERTATAWFDALVVSGW